jgi:hypothetical protein
MISPAPPHSKSFLLTQGGPTYRLEKRLGLIQANSSFTIRRAAFSILITWVPLLVLSALQHYAIGSLVPVPFLRDFAVHARFLLAVPILLLADAILGFHLARAASHFVESGLVMQEDFGRFEAAVDKGQMWRDATLPEIILIFLAYGITAITLTSTAFLHISTWYALRTDAGISLTWAGWWFVLFCVPLMQFLVLRWVWLLFLWAQFLSRMNSLNLQLIPTHPDEAGGLAFVGEAQRFFGIILFAFSAAASGVLANGIIYDGLSLRYYAPVIGVYAVISICIVLTPLFIFWQKLFETKIRGLYQYGTLATEYTSTFHHKWVVGQRIPDEALLGTADIQSLADLGNSYSFVEKMRALPIRSRTVLYLIFASLIPMAPLLLTMMPLEEILKMLVKVVL